MVELIKPSISYEIVDNSIVMDTHHCVPCHNQCG